MHQPLWLMEEGILIHREGKKELRKTKTGWPKVAKALKGRKHTVFAGAYSSLCKVPEERDFLLHPRNDRRGERAPGVDFGEFDHATWVTMTDEGPKMANLAIEGIMKDDVTTESHQKFWRSLVFEEHFQGQT